MPSLSPNSPADPTPPLWKLRYPAHGLEGPTLVVWTEGTSVCMNSSSMWAGSAGSVHFFGDTLPSQSFQTLPGTVGEDGETPVV